MRWHLIEGEVGCRYAIEHECTAVIVDALRASATAAALLAAGAGDLLLVREVGEARAAREAFPDALLYGERGGLPPEGFDGGNSPRLLGPVRGKRVIFTTTTGAGRVVQAWGAHAIFMGTCVNARAVVQAAIALGRDVVLIPAGLMGVPEFDAQEDRCAAAYLAQISGGEVGEGADMFRYWHAQILRRGLADCFARAPHAEALRAIGLEEDIAFCAQSDIFATAPRATARNPYGILLQ
jgi:2-phosphosulfolactate phosphatase